MRFPKLHKLDTAVKIRNRFGGYDHTDNTEEGEFFDCENISSDAYPLLSTRKPRGIWNAVQKNDDGETVSIDSLRMFTREGVTAAANVGGKIVLCAGGDVICDGERTGIQLDPGILNRTIVPFGRNFYIVPDAKYVIADDNGLTVKHGAKRFMSAGANIGCCFADGSFPDSGIWFGAPQSPSPGDILAEVTEDGVFKAVYDGESGEWLHTTQHIYTGVRSPGIGEFFEPGDTVTLSGFTDEALNGTFTVGGVTADKLMISTGGLFNYAESSMVTVEKKTVVLDYAVEHNNRVWGCRYGKNEDGEFVNEIYASAPGDPTVWKRFDGISTDSYCASVGCSGEFTGACVHGNDVLFFKEDYIIRVSGDTPSDFTVLTVPADGAEPGAFRSIVNVNDRIFYKSRSGITVFDGVMPYVVSGELGENRFADVCAGTAGGKYYFAGTDPSGGRKIYVYDTYRGLWHKEDDSGTEFFVYRKNCLYMICLYVRTRVGLWDTFVYRFLIHDSALAPDACSIFTGDDDGIYEYSYPAEKNIKWFAETGRIDAKGPQSLLLRKLKISLDLSENAEFAVDIRCGSGEWQRVFYSDREFSGAFTVPVRVPECDFFRLKFSGTGECVINAVTQIYEKTGGVNMFGR